MGFDICALVASGSGVILENDASEDALVTVVACIRIVQLRALGCRPGAGFPAGVPESQWLAIVVLAAAAGAVVVVTVVAEPWGVQGGRLVIPLLACVPVVVLRRWPLPVLGVVTAADLVTSHRCASPG